MRDTEEKHVRHVCDERWETPYLLVDRDRPCGIVPAQATIDHVQFPVVRNWGVSDPFPTGPERGRTGEPLREASWARSSLGERVAKEHDSVLDCCRHLELLVPETRGSVGCADGRARQESMSCSSARILWAPERVTEGGQTPGRGRQRPSRALLRVLPQRVDRPPPSCARSTPFCKFWFTQKARDY